MKITPFHVEMMGKRSSRHNILRDAIFATAAGALLAPLEEERALLPGSNNRPADVLIPHWTGGRDTGLDMTVVSPLGADMITREAF